MQSRGSREFFFLLIFKSDGGTTKSECDFSQIQVDFKAHRTPFSEGFYVKWRQTRFFSLCACVRVRNAIFVCASNQHVSFPAQPSTCVPQSARQAENKIRI